jgi:hypothetical protein
LAEVIAIAASTPADTSDKGHRPIIVAARYTREISLNAYRDLMGKLLQQQHAHLHQGEAVRPM